MINEILIEIIVVNYTIKVKMVITDYIAGMLEIADIEFSATTNK